MSIYRRFSILDTVVNEYQKNITLAAQYLSANDSILRPVIQRVGLCTITPHNNYYQELVESIIGQQLSLASAAAITKRFIAMFAGNFPQPETILLTSDQDLRDIGFSRAKAAYIKDLARHIIEGRIQLGQLESLSNEEIIGELTAVKGIGEWTVHMFLMFAMGRMNILAHGDLGVRNGIMKLYSLESPPSPSQIRDLAARNGWAPYESVACWYVWQSLKSP